MFKLVGWMSTCPLWINSHWTILAATPVAPLIAAADPEARKKIGASVMERLQFYVGNGPFARLHLRERGGDPQAVGFGKSCEGVLLRRARVPLMEPQS
jgi:hypothetical protein